MAVGKKLRFEIFKRDGFTCMYCARKPPEVVLEIDHVLAVSKDGGDEPDNLLTSCVDCNRGKGNGDLKESMIPALEPAEVRRERMEQVKALEAVMVEEREMRRKSAKDVEVEYARLNGTLDKEGRYTIPGELRGAVATFFRQGLLKGEIIEAIEITLSRFPRAERDYRFKFFCGVCWKKIRDKKAGK